ncbi:MAG: 4-oxalomesaconate tautomerase [Geminicoccaceae bacterium]
MQTPIPFLFMRGGTSRGPYFRREDLPADRETLTEVLMAAVGAGHPLNIDGIGGGSAVTTKVAMLSPSEHQGADVDYFFAQVAVNKRLVDFKPTCGNILSGVGPAAIEMGLIVANDPETVVRIHAVNTGALIEAVVQTPGGKLRYDGDVEIAGVPGTAAPIALNFMDVVGSSTGSLLPTGHAREKIGGIEVTCMDVAMPVVIARAADLGLSGYETAEELDENKDFYRRFEIIRIEAGQRMSMGDVTKSVIPKFAILAAPQDGGAIAARYFMPWNCHPSMAVTGAQCLASSVLTPGTVAEGIGNKPDGNPTTVIIEHPSGKIEVVVDVDPDAHSFTLRSAGIIRTSRLLARGDVLVPAHILTLLPEPGPGR